MAKPFDAIIIGSGFGGAISACRLAENGMRVLLLERGRRWNAESYPSVTGKDWIWDHDEPEKNNGWLDLRVFGDMSVAQGAGVGGGSLIYANVFINAKPDAFESGWPEEITYQELLPFYETVGRMLNAQCLPETQLTERYKLTREAAEKIGQGDRFTSVELAVSFDKEWNYDLEDPFNHDRSKKFINAQGQQQGTCIHLANCDIGCPVYAKNTLDLNYIPLAEKYGAQVRALHQAQSIIPEKDGYRIHYRRYENGRATEGSERATRVILSAGSIGTTELLLNCRDTYKTLPNISPRLGYGWSSNGDFLTPSYHRKRRISPTQGPTVTCAIDFLDGSQGGTKFIVEDGGFPDLVGNSLEQTANRPLAGLVNRRKGFVPDSLAKMIRSRDPLDKVMLWFGQAVDAGDGRLYLGRPWYAPWRKQLKMRWDYRTSEKAIHGIDMLHRQLAEATDGVPYTPFTWTWFRNLITPHPLGGCNMGPDKNKGVVDHCGQVFGYPNLYVADGAIIPVPLGLNPSRTISALAERNAKLIISEES